MSNGFCDRMWAGHREVFEAFWEHPFLAGLRDGTVPGEAVLHYVGQDHQYLNAYLRCYGLGVSRPRRRPTSTTCPRADTMRSAC